MGSPTQAASPAAAVAQYMSVTLCSWHRGIIQQLVTLCSVTQPLCDLEDAELPRGAGWNHQVTPSGGSGAG